MIAFILVIVVLYVITFLYLNVMWNRIPVRTVREYSGEVDLSVIVAMRNEEENIPELIRSLSEQSVTNFKLILVNDHSSDSTVGVAHQALMNAPFEYDILQLPTGRSGKKAAVEMGVRSAGSEWVMVTDADCQPYPNWIASTLSMVDDQTNLIAGPVSYGQNGGFLNDFLELDLISLIGITGACIQNEHPLFINGANMAFRKARFIEVDPYGNSKEASGDDVFLMRALQEKYPGSIRFNKDPNAMVLTDPPKSWGEFFHQRIRWSSKMGKGSMQLRNLIIGSLIFLTNLLLIAILVLSVVHPVFLGTNTWTWALVAWILKTSVDMAFFAIVVPLFGRRLPVYPYFIVIEILHVLYVIFFGILSRLLPYQWKSRKLQ